VLFLCFLMISNVEYEMIPKFSFREGRKNSIMLLLVLLSVAVVAVFRQKVMFPLASGFVLFYWLRAIFHHEEEEDEDELLDVTIPD
ncbi:MAG: hypothetical protein ACE5G1_17435, partial [bacterium]